MQELAATSSKKTPSKNTGKKRTSTANKGSSSATKTRAVKSGGKTKQTEMEGFMRSRELKATVIFILGLLLLLVAVFPGREASALNQTPPSLWNVIHTFYFAVFGLVGALLPPAVLFLGVLSVLNKNTRPFLVKTVEVLLFFALLCGILHVANVVNEYEGSFAENLSSVYHGIMDGTLRATSTGGVLGALIGGAAFSIGQNKVLAYVLLGILMVTVLMFLFGITLFKVFTRMEAPAKKVGEYTGQKIESVKDDYRERRREAQLARENRRKEYDAAAAATKVVNDFYEENEIDEETGEVKPIKKRDPAKKPDAHPASPEPELPAEPAVSPEDEREIFSIFDMLSKKDPSLTLAPQPEEGEDLPPFEPDLPPEGEGKKERLDPLSKEEAEALNAELDESLEAEKPIVYVKPTLDLLDEPSGENKGYDLMELQANGEKLIEALASFNVSATISDVVPGPTVTRYELSPAKGVKISKFTNLSDDLALHMAAPAGLRIEAPIPNKSAIGIEIPNRKRATISFKEIIDNDAFRSAKSKLYTALGKDISGDVIFADIAKMPHLLVAGTTGSGKSVCMNTMIVSLLYNATPDEVRILLVDPKQVEFGMYNGIPHLLVPVVSDPRKASGALGWAVTEMLSRYKTLNAAGVRDIGSYNSLCEGNTELTKMPQIVIFIDELADLMTVAPAEVEDSIQRIAQMGRAAGMHLVLATQRPSVDVITGVIKANIPSRIALTVKSQIDSRTMIDQAGAEKLMGYGDMLYYPVGVPKPVRVQGAFLKTSEIERVVEFLKSNGTAQYDDVVQQEIERQAAAEKKKGAAAEELAPGGASAKDDDLVARAVELFLSAPEKASISALQRHLSLGFAKAGRLMDALEEKGIVGPTEGSKPRKVLITKAQWYEMNAMNAGSADLGDASDAPDGGFPHEQ